jgi:hypothetical protein
MTTTENPALKLALSTVASNSNNSSQANDDDVFDLLDGDELAESAKAAVYLIDGILEEDAHGVFYGASMAFKSFAVLEMAHCICTGRDFMGHKVKKQGAVIYVCGEGKGGIGRRLRAQIITNKTLKNNFKMPKDSISINDTVGMAKLSRTIKKVKPVLVIFDTFAALVNGVNENDNGAVGAVLKLVRDTCRNEFKTSSMIIHHTGKDETKGMRGASTFRGTIDYEFSLSRSNDFCTVMHCEKMKEGENFKDIHMVAVPVDLGIFDDDMKESTSLILKRTDVAKADNKKALDSEERKVLEVLTKLMTSDDAMTPPKSVIDQFPDNPEKAPPKVTTVRAWLDLSYEVITVTSEPEKEKEAKRSRFNRTRTKLYKNGFIGVHGDVVWIAYTPQTA